MDNNNNKQENKLTPKEIQKLMWEEEEKLTLEERRDRYKCGKRFVTLGDLDSYETTLEKLKITSAEEVYSNTSLQYLTSISLVKMPKFEPNLEINSKICTWQGDITRLEIDAIVNAANSRLLGGGGIDGCIHSAAGGSLYKECLTLGGANTGETKITRAYKLPSKYVLHTVGPIGEKEELLRSCYTTVLNLCLEYNIKTVALCGISTGIFGYPLYNASHVACETVRKWLEEGDNKDKIEKIIFCTFLDKEKVCYDKLLPIYFPPPYQNKENNTNNNENQNNNNNGNQNNNSNNENNTNKNENQNNNNNENQNNNSNNENQNITNNNENQTTENNNNNTN